MSAPPSPPVYPPWVVVKESSKALKVGPSKESGQLMLKRLELPDDFKGCDFKDKMRERVAGCLISSRTSSDWLVVM